MDKLLKYLRTANYKTLVYNPPKDFKDFFIKRTKDTEFIGLLKLKDNKEKPIKDIIVDETSKDCLKTSCAVEILALYNEYHCTSIDSKSRREEPKIF